MDEETTKGKEGTQGRRKLAIAEIEALSDEEWQALPEDQKRRYFEWMDRENFPTPEEFYGCGYEWRLAEMGLKRDEEGCLVSVWDEEGLSCDDPSCDGPARPEPDRQKDQESQRPEKLDMLPDED
jgi:hypothetical protein